uniref:Putative lipocalin-3 1 n=1 Tax=Rhipicephalus microplus TaxID=6941 RepID=A0A6M2D4Y5_RHIMP
MSQRSILCVGVFALVLAKSASLEIENSNSSEDIFEFYNTSELIWTTNTTAKQRRVCKVDLKETITRDNVTFRRSFYDGRRGIIGEYIGTFRKFGTFNRTARQPNDTMDVKKNNGYRTHSVVTEVLHYQSADNSCAVFWILGTYWGSLTPWYELRMRDSKIKKGFHYEDSCWEALNSTRQRIRPAYHPKCQIVLKDKYPNPREGEHSRKQIF